MPITIVEFRESRRITRAKDTETADLVFVGFGETDDNAARLAFQAAVPANFTPFTNTLPLLGFDVAPRGGGFWRCDAHYGPDNAPLYPAVGIVGPPTPVNPAPGPNTALGPNFAFDFEGVTEKILQSKQTQIRQKPGGDAVSAPDAKGAIGITADGTVEGCERVSPNLVWSYSVTFASVTMQYIDDVKGLVGSSNDATFFNKPKGSQIFLGGNCQIDDTLRAKCTFKFLDRPNLTSVPICAGFTVTAPTAGPVASRTEAKLGSEYLWVRYNRVADANAIVMQPTAAYVEQITDLMDWSKLRIGV